jgi:polar amino acid transport system substrate-binding protein
MNIILRIILVCVMGTLPEVALAECSRPINVPAAPDGVSVVVKPEGQVTGVIPDILRTVAKETGCEFKFSVAPRARLEMLFGSGDADLLLLSTQTPERDRSGQFVPLFKVRAVLVSVKPLDKPVQSIEDLILRTDLRVCLVRGYDYGPAYRRLTSEEMTGRWCHAPHIPDLLRRLRANMADVTILLPGGVFGAVRSDSRLKDLEGKLQFAELDDIPWQDAGVYVSSRTLPTQDQALLINAFRKGGASAQAMKGFAEALPPSIRKMTVRRR